MGVSGLTRYIKENSDLYLKPIELSDTYLVVDGNSIGHQLYQYMTKSEPAFGGDYDEFYQIVKNFFLMLNKCKITPIVVFDGGHEKKKINTILSRATQKILRLKTSASDFLSYKYYPIFMKLTFCDVMEDLKIHLVQCDFEADGEIAALARALNCPVLSSDSDFFIYDVLYIPFSSVSTTPFQGPDSEYRLQCSIYDVRNLMEQFDGLDKSLLPIAATVLGNDYVENFVFIKFFNHVSIPSKKGLSYNQRKIHGLLNWLKKENVDSAIKLIVGHTDGRHQTKVLEALNSGIDDYRNNYVSVSVIKALNDISNQTEFSLKEKKFEINLPSEFNEIFRLCKLDTFVIDMIFLKTYFLPIQIEELQKNSSHIHSLDLIKALYSILKPYMIQSGPNYLKVYLTVNDRYVASKINVDGNENHKSLKEILNEPKEIRIKFLYEIVGVTEDDEKTISMFNINWTVFLLGFIYWIKKLDKSLNQGHVYALLLMALCNQVVQKDVGYFRKLSTFMKCNRRLLNKLKDTDLGVAEDEDKVGESFDELLSRVTTYECLLVEKDLIPLRQTSQASREKAYDISVIHFYSCFQSCLYHITQINALLYYPLPSLKISNFFSGTLLFNFYLNIKHNPDVVGYGEDLFKVAPNILKVYKYMCANLCGYFSHQCLPAATMSKRNKKKRKRNRNTKMS